MIFCKSGADASACVAFEASDDVLGFLEAFLPFRAGKGLNAEAGLPGAAETLDELPGSEVLLVSLRPLCKGSKLGCVDLHQVHVKGK